MERKREKWNGKQNSHENTTPLCLTSCWKLNSIWTLGLAQMSKQNNDLNRTINETVWFVPLFHWIATTTAKIAYNFLNYLDWHDKRLFQFSIKIVDSNHFFSVLRYFSIIFEKIHSLEIYVFLIAEMEILPFLL